MAVLSVPSTGLWAEQPAPEGHGRGHGRGFQYPLRAYGLSNPTRAMYNVSEMYFQYPLRAYGLSNLSTFTPVRNQPVSLSVPSTGLWAEQLDAGAMVSPPVGLSVPSTGLWAEQRRLMAAM